MKRALLLAVLILPAACAPGPRPSVAAVPEPVRPAPPATPEVKDPNFILVVSESVPNPDDDGISFTKVFVDGKEAGKTAVGRKADERTLKLKLPVGNQPIRLEQWNLPGVGEWTRLEDDLQPRERFVRIEDGSIARLELRFSGDEASNTLAVSREPAAP
ncbi:MAG: hypothetical protein KGJ84_12320 [Elusimicrobia bacterium]|nr:hypothetical protein [Elusimicrobiota bacterium]